MMQGASQLVHLPGSILSAILDEMLRVNEKIMQTLGFIYCFSFENNARSKCVESCLLIGRFKSLNLIGRLSKIIQNNAKMGI